jgi:ribosomal protein S18 acetylase RimI-like enzyme
MVIDMAGAALDVPGLCIRDYTMADYESLIQVWEAAGLHHKPGGRDSREEVERQAGMSVTIILLGVMDDKLAGTIVCTHDGRKGWLNRLAVHPDNRGLGVARALVEEGERRLRAEGIRIIGVLVEDWNTVSCEIFAHLGYERHDDITYFSKREDESV